MTTTPDNVTAILRAAGCLNDRGDVLCGVDSKNLLALMCKAYSAGLDAGAQTGFALAVEGSDWDEDDYEVDEQGVVTRKKQ